MTRNLVLLSLLATVASAGAAEARDQIRIVGSSTVYPFTTTVAEQFGKTTKFKTPVIESTGTGGGFKLFCGGVGVEHPDISNASRAIKKSEVESCVKNGVKEITEVKIGFDGIVVANSKASPQANMSLKQLYTALAKELPDGKGGFKPNPYQKWSEIDPALPDNKIEVLGPPPTSGTRDAFVELAMEPGCEAFEEIKALKKEDEKKFKAICHSVREDGGYVEAGENDVLIVRKLEANPKAFGVFGFSFLDQNADKIQGSKINGVVPAFEAIADGKYAVSRPLFIYVKKAHVGVIPGIEAFVAEFTSEKAFGPDGYLSGKGLIPLPNADRAKVRKEATGFAANVAM
jgi:phosphate transport system substrate-binding protein